MKEISGTIWGIGLLLAIMAVLGAAFTGGLSLVCCLPALMFFAFADSIAKSNKAQGTKS